MKSYGSKTTSSKSPEKGESSAFQQNREGAFFSKDNALGNKETDAQPFFSPTAISSNLPKIQASPISPRIQRSPISTKVDDLWKTKPDRETILNLLAQDDAFKNRTDADLEKSLTTIFTDPNDLWLAKKILNRQLGESKGTIKSKPVKLPIELAFFKGTSSEKALVIAGVHGTEQQGIETANILKTDLATQQPYFNVVLVPSLFPINAKKRIRQGKNETNRNFPKRGETLSQAKTDKDGDPLDADGDKILIENQLLIQLIERYKPSRIISIHGTQYAHQAGVFSDQITKEPDHAKLLKEAGELAAYMLEAGQISEPGFHDPQELQKLTRLLYGYMLQEAKRKNEAQTKRDETLSDKTAQAIAKDTAGLSSIKDRFKAAGILKKVEVKFKKGSVKYKAAVESLKQNPAVAGNKLDQPKKSTVWAGATPGGVSLGGYAPSLGVSVFTVEPAINRESAKYPKGTAGVDPGVTQADRLAELQAYADAIRTILLGK